jgi:hypothetical protein
MECDTQACACLTNPNNRRGRGAAGPSGTARTLLALLQLACVGSAPHPSRQRDFVLCGIHHMPLRASSGRRHKQGLESIPLHCSACYCAPLPPQRLTFLKVDSKEFEKLLLSYLSNKEVCIG